MSRSLFAVSLVASAILLTGCNGDSNTAAPSFETNEQKLSYSIGQNFAGQLQQSGIAIDLDALKAGLDDGFVNAEPRVSAEDVQTAQQAIMQELQAQQQAEFDIAANENAAASAAFLTENATKEGVQVTASGLQYKVINQGDGPMPSDGDTVRVHYKGTLVDGTEFDSSYSRGEPAEFPVNAVISGWTEALQLMNVGAKYELYIPADLAYGPGGTGPIGPNAALIFEVELLAIVE